ncbi:WYL domain-containing protein [Acidiphilium multivorum]|uniref:helix-turn-helix transcriptional regulator n=1 Tax=Acidiphilium multivorum TaxID=62140 RepID=UPI001F4BD8E9|nr:WYL domain-containing protein [Acidiphilium multivorum]UNC13972.1 WYL domain-containing protein [Acidiphilium multivorum]
MNGETGNDIVVALSRGAGHCLPVRYEPAMRLLRLVTLLAGSRTGLTLDEMATELEVGRRTVERLRDRLQDVFPQLEAIDGDDRVRRWRLPRGALPVLPVQPTTIATLETVSIELAGRGEAARASDLREAAATLRAMMSPDALRMAEPDIEALMQAEGSAAQPGPKLKLDRDTLLLLREAILGMRKLQLKYRPAEAKRATARLLCPYAILYGRRAYLVAHTDTTTEMRLWRIDRISEIEVQPDLFNRQEFDLATYASQSFGVFQEPPQDVVLRFIPEAADEAADWVFHPHQTMERQPDGSLIVRFRCGGMQELDWHLYTWGTAATVLTPKRIITV